MKTSNNLFFLFLFGIFMGSCVKADFSSMDANLQGTWQTAFSDYYTGIYITFSSGSKMHYTNNGNSNSMEDNVKISGNAGRSFRSIWLQGHRFTIEEYPVAFDTIIRHDVYNIHTHWKMKMRIGKSEVVDLYKE